MVLPMADMDTALIAAGIPFVEVGYQPADPTGATSWKDRGRPPSTGPFHPEGVLCHHTASPAGTSDHTDIACILAGNSSAPGPISQIYIGRTGVVYLIAAGRANHGGKGIRPGIDSGCQDMNAALCGIEAGNNGVGEHWSDNMTTVYGRVVAALCAFYGWGIDAVYLHATTGPPSGGCNSKIDPAGPWQREPDIGSATWSLDVWRQFCIDVGGLPAPGEDEMTEDDWSRMRAIVHEEVLALWRAEEIVNTLRETSSTGTSYQLDAIENRAFNADVSVMRSQEFSDIVGRAANDG